MAVFRNEELKAISVNHESISMAKASINTVNPSINAAALISKRNEKELKWCVRTYSLE